MASLPDACPDHGCDSVWNALAAVARLARGRGQSGDLAATAPYVRQVDDRWEACLAQADPCRPFMDLYLPLAAACAARPLVVAHMGQSIDGFIAMASGESHFVTGRRNIEHLHRLRALADAVIVGAGTVAADNPRLTTRLVPGPNPLRVVLDPNGRLPRERHVYRDGAAPTLRVCAAGVSAGAGDAEVLHVGRGEGRLDLAELLARLRERGHHAVLVEGGGVTVSAFLAAGLLDRLHVAIAPVVIGEGRPGVRLPAPARLADALRPRHARYAMGEDVLFDFDLRA